MRIIKNPCIAVSQRLLDWNMSTILQKWSLDEVNLLLVCFILQCWGAKNECYPICVLLLFYTNDLVYLANDMFCTSTINHTHACTKWKIRRTFFALMYSYFSYYFNYVLLFSNATSTNGSETKFVGRLRSSTNHYEDGSES